MTMPRGARLLAWTAAVAALALVFTLYLSPHIVVDLATRLWACF